MPGTSRTCSGGNYRKPLWRGPGNPNLGSHSPLQATPSWLCCPLGQPVPAWQGGGHSSVLVRRVSQPSPGQGCPWPLKIRSQGASAERAQSQWPPGPGGRRVSGTGEPELRRRGVSRAGARGRGPVACVGFTHRSWPGAPWSSRALSPSPGPQGGSRPLRRTGPFLLPLRCPLWQAPDPGLRGAAWVSAPARWADSTEHSSALAPGGTRPPTVRALDPMSRNSRQDQ